MTPLARLTLEHRGEVTVATIQGDIDLSNGADLREAIAGAVRNRARGVVVDLSEVSYLDSVGIQLLFDLARRLGRRQQQLRLVLPRDAPVREILAHAGADDAIPADDAVEDAMAVLACGEDASDLDWAPADPPPG